MSLDALQIDGLAGAFGHWNSALRPVSASISNIRADSSYGLGAFMEDQPTEVIGEVGQDLFRLSKPWWDGSVFPNIMPITTLDFNEALI